MSDVLTKEQLQAWFDNVGRTKSDDADVFRSHESLRSALADAEDHLHSCREEREAAEAVRAKAERGFADARADLDAMTKDRDEKQEMAAQFCEQAAEWSGKLNASLTEQMRENCDACKEMAPAFANKAEQRAIAAERACGGMREALLHVKKWNDEPHSIGPSLAAILDAALAACPPVPAGDEGVEQTATDAVDKGRR